MKLDAYPPQVVSEIERIRVLPIVVKILDQLSNDLPAKLAYHSAKHTNSVLAEAIHFAMSDNLPPREIELLAVSAAYHDAGFLVQEKDNEPIGAAMAEEAMKASNNYSPEEIELVKNMILDTRLLDNGARYTERASSELSKYLLDADVSNFGRADFFERLDQIVKEFGVDKEAHRENTRRLLENHVWLTPAAKKLREAQKQENLRRLSS